MSTVVIEGSLSPSSFLARGDRMEVQRSEFVEKLIVGGFVNVISETEDPEITPPAELSDPAVPPLVDNEPAAEPPPRSGAGSGREEWAEFLAKHPGGFVTEGKDRTDLIGEWDDYLQKQAEADQPEE